MKELIQSPEKKTEQSKENKIEQGQNSDAWFYAILGCNEQHFISRRETGDQNS